MDVKKTTKGVKRVAKQFREKEEIILRKDHQYILRVIIYEADGVEMAPILEKRYYYIQNNHMMRRGIKGFKLNDLEYIGENWPKIKAYMVRETKDEKERQTNPS